MKKIRIGIVGGGWRARFFTTAAQHLPELFELTGIYVRNPEKAAALSEELKIPAFTSIEELAETKPEYVVVSISRTASFEILCKCMELGLHILCETPPVWSFEDLTKLWDFAKAHGTKFQVAEQYFARPLMAAQLKLWSSVSSAMLPTQQSPTATATTAPTCCAVIWVSACRTVRSAAKH